MAAFRPGKTRDAGHVVVAVQHKLGAGRADGAAEMLSADQPPVPRRRAGDRRMVDEDDAEEIVAAERVEGLRQRLGLGRADPARRHQRRGGDGTRHADQRHRLAHADEGKAGRAALVAGHVRSPCRGVVADSTGKIGVVVAGNDGDVALRHRVSASQARAASTSAGSPILIRSPVTAMWSGSVRAEVVDQRDEAGRTERRGPPAAPVGVAESTLRREVAPADRRQRPEMRIGEMGEGEHRARIEESN